MSNDRRVSQIAGDKSGERSIVSSVIEEEDEDDQSNDSNSSNDSNDSNASQSFTIQEDDDEDNHSNTSSDSDSDSDNDENADIDDNDDDLSETVYDENDQSTTYRSHYGTSLGPFSDDESDDDEASIALGMDRDMDDDDIGIMDDIMDDIENDDDIEIGTVGVDTVDDDITEGVEVDEESIFNNRNRNRNRPRSRGGDAAATNSNGNGPFSDDDDDDDGIDDDNDDIVEGDDDDDDDDTDVLGNSQTDSENIQERQNGRHGHTHSHNHNHNHGRNNRHNRHHRHENRHENRTRPQDYRNEHTQEAESVLQDLLEQYEQNSNSNNNNNNNHHHRHSRHNHRHSNTTNNNNNNNNISHENYKNALVQLSTKWEQIHQTIAYDHEQQLLSIAQERNELEMEIHDMEQRHQDELGITKQEVMEQSQKIIMQEMKSNADREIKSEETIDLAVKQAIEETKVQMNEEFDIAFGGMKDAQRDMQLRYEKLVKDTQVKVRFEVQQEVSKAAEVKMHSFMENYEEMKSQVVDLTMELEKKQMQIDTGIGIDMDMGMGIDMNMGINMGTDMNKNIIQEKDREIEELNETLNRRTQQMQDLIKKHQEEVQTLESSVQQDKKLLVQKINTFEQSQKREYEEMLKVETQKEVDRNKVLMKEEMDCLYEGRNKSFVAQMEGKYEQIRKDAELKMREELCVELRVELRKEMRQELREEMHNEICNEMHNEICNEMHNEIRNEVLQEVKEEKESFIKETSLEVLTLKELNEEMKTQLVDKTMEVANLKSNQRKIQEVESIVIAKEEEIELLKDKLELAIGTQTKFETQIVDMKSLYNTQVDTLTEQLDARKNEIQSLQVTIKSNDNVGTNHQQEIEKMKDLYEDQLAKLQTKVDGGANELSQREIEYQKSIDLCSEKVSGELKMKYEEQIKLLEQAESKKTQDIEALYTEQIQILQQKYQDEKTNLKESNDKINDSLVMKEKEIQLLLEEGNTEIKLLKDDHETKIDKLEESHRKEMAEIHAILDSVQMENNKLQDINVNTTTEFKEAMKNMKREHAANVERMKARYNQAKSELQTELTTLSPRRRTAIKRETINSGIVEGLTISVSNSQDSDNDLFVLPAARTALSRSVKSGEDNKENSTEVESIASTLMPSSTPPRKYNDHSFQDLSPLTLGSPSPKVQASKASRVASTTALPQAQKIPDKMNKSRPSLDIPRSVVQSSKRAPRLSSTKIPSPQMRTTSRRTPTSGTDHKKTSTRSVGGSKSSRSPASSNASSIKVVDRTPDKNSFMNNRLPANGGLVSLTRRRESTRNTQVEKESFCLMIINVTITDKMKKMAKILKLELTDDPLEATHVIAGDSKIHIRRTAKFMAALCVTSNILKAEWLEDSYKKRSLLSCSRYLLLNDSRAENIYSFSMKQTLIEGKERRRDGGLLSGWKIMICDNVARKKAPKEEDLRMMIEAAGGDWLLSSDIPVPIRDDPTHVIVITSDPALPSQIEDDKASIAAESGAGFFTTTWLFDCMMHQKLFGLRRGIGRV